MIQTFHRNGNGKILTQIFSWDAVSNKTYRSANVKPELSNGDIRSDQYHYDNLYRLNDFDYDDAGNRLGGDYSIGETADEDSFKMNEYQSTPYGAVEHDDNGNQTMMGAVLMEYDYKNRLTKYGDVTYKYDALNRRIAKVAGTDETKYYSFGDRIVLEEQADGDKLTFVYGGFIDDVITMELRDPLQGINDYFVLHDDMYNVMALTDVSGSVVERYDYSIFGKPLFQDAYGTGIQAHKSIYNNHVLFNGRWFDEESEYYYYRSRYYNPNIGRFTSRDTLGIWADPMNLGNGYTYAANNPWTFSDPHGFRADRRYNQNYYPYYPTSGLADVGAKFPKMYLGNPMPVGDPNAKTDLEYAGDVLYYSGGFALDFAPGPVGYGKGLFDSYNTFFRDENPSTLDYIGAVANLPPGGKQVSSGIGLAAGTIGTIASLSRKLPSGNSIDKIKSLYHYTDDIGLEGILKSKQLNPSLKAINPKDTRFGDGQYFSDIIPGTKSNASLSRTFIHNPFQGNKFKNYIEVDVSDLNIKKGRAGVYVNPSSEPLDISNRIINYGVNE